MNATEDRLGRTKRFGSTELRKALATTGSGQYLVPEDLEPAIRDYLWYLSPLTERIQLVRADGHLHKVPRRTAVNRGWFEGESTAPTYSQGTYDQRQVEVKIMRTSGKVTDFMQSASRTFVDAVAAEIDSSVKALADVLEYSSMYGITDDLSTYNFTGDAYQYTGLYGWIIEDALTNNVRDANSNAAAGATMTLTMLDKMYAQTVGKYRNFMRDPYIWLMSQDMSDKASGLQARVTRQSPSMTFEGGFVMQTYKNIPILPSQFCAPGTTASPTTPAATIGAGGALGAATYYYRIAAITLYGEQVACAEVSAISDGAPGNATATLTWTANANAKLYAIYRGTASGDNNLGLLDIIAAKTYDATGAVTANVATYVDANAITTTAAIQPLDLTEETVWLVNLGKEYGISRPVLIPTLGTPVDNLLRYAEIPVATDEYAYRIKGFHCVQVPRGESSCVLRRAKAV